MKKIITLALIVLSSTSLVVSATDSSSLSEDKRTQNMVAETASTTEAAMSNSSQSNQKPTSPPQTSENSEDNASQTTTDTPPKKEPSSGTLSLNGMTWQKNTGTGSDVNIGVAYQSKSDVIFNWQYYDISNKTWETINSNTASNWITFKAPHVGQYLIHVYGTTAEGETKEYTIGWNVEPETAVLKGMTWQTLEKNASKANIGVAYTSNSKLTFTWQYYDITKKEWHIVAKDTTSNWMTVTLPRSGQYLIHVEAKTESGKTVTYDIGWNVAADTVNLTGMTWQHLKQDASSANIGIAYTSNSNLTFTWQYYDIAKKEWHQILKDTTSNWITFNSPHYGQYLIHVEARTKEGTTATYSIGWQVFSKDGLGEILPIFNSSNNVMSAGYYNLVTGESVYKNGKSLVTSASTYKLFIALYVFDLIESGRANWNTRFSNGTFMTGFYDMIINSGNAFPEWVKSNYGYNNIDSFLKSKGYAGIYNYSDRATTSAEDLVKILKYYYTNSSNSNINYLLDLMKKQNYRSGIPSGTGVITADKVGFLWDIRNDAGIVYSSQAYILVVMTNGQYKFDLIANISKRVQSVQ